MLTLPIGIQVHNTGDALLLLLALACRDVRVAARATMSHTSGLHMNGHDKRQ
jgi:hypothetical protein